jgi:hypothetical protein
MKQYCDHTTRTPIRIPRHKLNTVEKLLPKINKVVNHINTETITETNHLLYAIAITVYNVTNPNIRNLKSKAKSPPWKQRLEHKIKKLRSELSQLSHCLHTKNKPSYELTQKYWIDKRGLPYAVENAEQRLVAMAQKLNRYN